MSVTRINIKINPSSTPNGVIVNTHSLSQQERSKKDSLYAPQVAQRDTQKSAKPRNTSKQKQNQSIPMPQVRHNPSNEQVSEMQRQTNAHMKQLNENQASLGMIYTSNQILKQQNQLLYENQKTMNQLVNYIQKEESPTNKVTKATNRKQQQQQLKQVTEGVNYELDEIRKIRDEIIRTAKEVSDNLGALRGNKVEIPGNLIQMNQNLRSMAQNSLKNIDLLSPQKFQLVNKIQNFNIEGYTHHLNQLKKQIAEMQRESENVQKQLRQRVSKLEKVNISPQFQAQLLEPYERNIKQKLATIDLQETRRKVYQRLGEYDYFKFENQLNDLIAEVKQEMGRFDLICKEFRVNVPILRFDQKQMKALDLKLPSILDEYKQSRGINLRQKPQQALKNQRNERQFIAENEKPLLSKGSIGAQKKTDVQQIPSKPKDLSNEIQYKKVVKQQYKTILQTQPNRKRQEQRGIEQNNKLQISPKRKNVKDEQEQNFQAYLQNRKNQQLELLYKERRDQLQRMKNQLYDESTEPMTKITIDRRNMVSFQQDNIKPQTKESRRKEESNIGNISKDEDSIGSRIFDPNEGAIKEIGKQVLKEKLRQMLKNPQSQKKEGSYQPILPVHLKQQQSVSTTSMSAFAEGFLTVINNTFAEMNRGLAQSIQKKHPQRRASLQKPRDQPQRIRIPFPQLQQIPKPPVFNLQFNYQPKPMAQFPQPAFPTFSNNFPMAQIKDYNNIDVSDVESYSYIHNQHDRSLIKSDISNVPSDISNI